MPTAVRPADLRRWRRRLADEYAEAEVYRHLAARRTGEEREILLALADAEGRHAAHWEQLLLERGGVDAADSADRARRGSRFHPRTAMLPVLSRLGGTLLVLALVQRAEARSPYDGDLDATPAMAADERIHGEVVRALAMRGRTRISGTFRAAVFGANDGLVSNLALVLGVAGGGVEQSAVLLAGIAGLLAGALSMGAGEYVSVRSQRELLAASAPDPDTRERLAHLDLDANELTLVYRARGMAPDEARDHAAAVLGGLAAAGIGTDDDAHAPAPSPGPGGARGEGADEHEVVGSGARAAVSSFCFFAAGALVPLLPFLVGLQGWVAIVVAAALVGTALLVTGAVVGVLSGASPLLRGLRQLGIGLGAAAITYGLGALFGATVG